MKKSDLEQIARAASLEFLKNGASLNDFIIQAAQKQSLTNDHIQRICEFSNHMVRKAIFKQKGVNQAEVTFPYADAQAVILSLARPAGNDEVHDDYLAPPSVKTKVTNDDPKINKEASIRLFNDGLRKQAEFKEANNKVWMKALDYGGAREKFASAVIQHFRNRGTALELAKIAEVIDKGDVLQAVMNNLEATTPPDVKNAVEEIKGVMHPDVSVVRINEQAPVTRSYNYLVTTAKAVREAATEAKQVELELENYTKASAAAATPAAGGGGIGGMVGPAMNAYWAYSEMQDWMKNVGQFEELYGATPQGKAMAVNQMTRPLERNTPRWKAGKKPINYSTQLASLYTRPGDPK